MIFTTTNTVDGYEITKYLRIIAGETVTGINMLKDFGASIRNITGGRASGYESEAIKAREAALDEFEELCSQGIICFRVRQFLPPRGFGLSLWRGTCHTDMRPMMSWCGVYTLRYC